MKTTVEIPDALLREARGYASARGLTFKAVLESCLRRTLEAERTRGPAFRLRKHTFKGRGLAIEGGWEAIRAEIYSGRGGTGGAGQSRRASGPAACSANWRNRT